MSTIEASPAAQRSGEFQQPVVNDFSIQVATVNGSGSQTANSVLMRSIFQMGIPVSGKNMFPSNIAGLPTWFTIRASKQGFIARKKEIDFLVAMNPETAREDVMKLDGGAAVVYDEPLKLDALRSDLHFYPVPFDKLVGPVCPEAKLRKLVRNMIYDGIVANLLSIDMEEVHKALLKQFGKKKAKAAELNWGACQAGYDYAAKTFTKSDPFRVQRMNSTAGKIIIEGNAAAALGCVFAGVTVVTWYPITPSSSLVESMIGYLKRFRIDKETGKATYAVVQAEDELSAIGMVLGAAWAGARSATSTAGPGISLMAEFVGLGYYAEIPAVIFDVQRVGGFARYKDVDGDGVGYRTVPGTNHPQAAYFTRGSGHNEKAQYTEREDDYVNNMDRLSHKFETMRAHVPKAVVEYNPKATVGFVAFVTSHYAVEESRDQLKSEYGIETSYLRLRAYPFAQDLLDFIHRHDRVYVIEQNRDYQMIGLL